MSPSDLVQLAVTFVAWAAVAVRVAGHLRGGKATVSSRWLTAALVAIAVAFTVGWPPLMNAVAGDGAGLVALRVGQHAAALAAATAATAFTAYATATPARARRSVVLHGGLLGVALAVMGAAAAVAVGSVDAGADWLNLLAPPHAGTAGVAAYLVAYAAVLGSCLAEVARLCLRRRGRETRAASRTGLLLLAVGSAVGTVYSAHRILAALGLDLGPAGTSFALTAVALLLVVVGASVVGVGGQKGR
ncbi:hypothetical protein [Phytomonospora endophytica]|uniref:Uncharacterized protein n=1 Tax=Phytomonospora endophytica TaxID=714109 RepID=A0A841G5A1_9ACTN|nr:hypothetical protein [Phytomonospora endophytica]MBB6039939.1 hypothetical protein [Phytomonospora endophytica]GIG70990.1 hypothetical protein Pen01_72850 [Phytomonospora endophytica]